MDNFKYFLFLFFLLFLIFNNVFSQLTPISLNSTLLISEARNQKYIDYPQSSYQYSCNINLYFIVEDTSSNGINSIINISAFENTSTYGVFLNYVKQENGYTYFFISSSIISNKTSPSSIFLEINATTNYLDSVSYQVKYQCLYPDTSNASVYFHPNTAQSLIINDGAYSAVKVDGLNFIFKTLQSSTSTLDSWGDNTFLFYISLYESSVLAGNKTIERSFYVWDKIFNLTIDNPFYSNEIVVLDEIITYPNNLTNDVKQFGTGFTPFLTFRTNSTLNLPLQYNSLFILIPLYGTRGNITYASKLLDQLQYGGSYQNIIVYYNGSAFNNLIFNVISTNLYPIAAPVLSINYNNNDTIIDIPMFKHSFLITPYYYSNYLIRLSNFYFSRSFPFGFVNGNNNNCTHQVAYPIGQFTISQYYSITPLPLSSQTSFVYINFNASAQPITPPPQLLSYEFIHIIGTNYLLRIKVFDAVGLDCINAYTTQNLTMSYNCIRIGETLVEGNKFNGTHEIVIDVSLAIDIGLVNEYGITNYYTYDTYITYRPIYQYLPPVNPKMQIDAIIDITFLYNNISLVDGPCHNIAYIKPDLTKISKSQGMKFMIRDHQSMDILTGYHSSWNVVWDESKQLFISKFILPKGSIYGNIQYNLKLDSKTMDINIFFPESSQLIVNSTYYYNVGPYLSNIEKVSGENVTIQETGSLIGWRLTIKEDYYGFNRGYVKVIGTIDNSIYHFNFTLSNAVTTSNLNNSKFESVYDVVLNITSPCLSQDYLMEIVELEGITGIKSYFAISDNYPNSIKNPFKLFLSDPLINRVNTVCVNQVPNDTTPPILTDFKVSVNTIDVSSPNRLITFNFTAIDNETGLKKDQYPIVYIIGKRIEIVDCISRIVTINEISATYTCSVILPYSFGYPGSVLLSVYGFINNGGYYSGFTSFDLQSLSFQYYINTTLISRSPYIKSNELYLSDGGDLVLYGYGLENIHHLFFNFSGSTFSLLSKSNFSNVIVYKDFYPTEKPFTVKAINKNSIESNEYTVYPIYFNPNLPTPSPTDTPSPSPTDTPSPTPTVTNTLSPSPTPTPTPTSNVQCLGTPEPCGGSKRGYCSNGQCSCYSPWVGPTCSSQIIIVPQPSTNTSTPSIEIPTNNGDGGLDSSDSKNNNGNNNNNNNIEKIFFKSLISMVSLRELDYNGDQVKQYLFDKWIYTQINEHTNLYFTNITSSTNITVKLEWFINETQINFAGFNLTMQPSTIKYTIDIGKYEFQSKLNKLQLIMSASFSASKSNDICSSKEFGSINDENDSSSSSSSSSSNYIKIQIDNHSLYGRYIKRALIDGTPKSIDNVLLDSSFNTISSDNNNDDGGNSASSVQSFIGITIPWYNDNISIDPDFSVLVDSNSVSPSSNNNGNTICNLSKSGLTKTQLTGIIVGSVGFASVITVISAYAIYQHRRSKIFVSKITNSLKSKS